MRFTITTAAFALMLSAGLASPASSQERDLLELRRLSKQGRTLPLSACTRFPLAEQKVRDDSGINVLLDLAHQATFAAMWRLPPELRRRGFRVCGSQACLDTVLQPGRPSRVRLRVGARRPFAWWPTARFNVVITFQSSPRSQDYLPREQAALESFVRAGGGLIVVGADLFDAQAIEAWSLNTLLRRFGAGISPDADRAAGRRVATLALEPGWEVVERGRKARALIARRPLGRGRVVVFSSGRLFFWNKKAAAGDPTSRASRGRAIEAALRWAAGGSPPVGGSPRLPREASGGGPIYPELEQNVGGVIVYYAANQKKELLQAVRRDMPRAKKQIEAWLPSLPGGEPMYLIVAAGGGGGWAVNAYLPKETGIISLTARGLLSVFGHELAHTMGGPPNERGEVAADWPQGNQGESHAGWFQGKINALFDESLRSEPNRNCNRLFSFDPKGDALDLAMDPAALRARWGKGKEWTKIWWVWQKLDDRYGPTWYPRWRWVQSTRWRDEPTRRLGWSEVVEDMSIAVGEDLFPFFTRIGTTLSRKRWERASFQGRTLELSVAPLEVSPAGAVRLEAIGDYRRPLVHPAGKG